MMVLKQYSFATSMICEEIEKVIMKKLSLQGLSF